MPPRPTIAMIRRAVCAYYEVGEPELLSRRCDRAVARPRQVAMYLARELAHTPFSRIGRHLGDRDHTTALHGWRRIQSLIGSDLRIAAEIDDLRRLLAASVAQQAGTDACWRVTLRRPAARGGGAPA